MPVPYNTADYLLSVHKSESRWIYPLTDPRPLGQLYRSPSAPSQSQSLMMQKLTVYPLPIFLLLPIKHGVFIFRSHFLF